MAIEIDKPNFPKFEILIWKDLALEDVYKLNSLNSYEEYSRHLGVLMNLEDHETNKKSKILIDLYYHSLIFAKNQHFSEDKTSTFFSILKRTHEAAMSSPFGSEKMYFDYFKEILLRHSVRRPPFSVGLFSPNDAQDIMRYVMETYFRHFKMYKYVFTPIVRLNLSLKYEGMEEEEEESIKEPSPAEEVEEEVEVVLEAPQETAVEKTELSELRQIITKHITPELESLRKNLETQLKDLENNINKQIETASTSKGKKSTK